jgi:hypothetical protein
MQPVEEEEIQTKTDKHIEYAVDCLMGFCLKKPKSCCGGCASRWKHPVAVWGYRGWQLAIVMYMLIDIVVPQGIGDLLCEDSDFFGSSTGRNFRCPAVQTHLKWSNYTNHSNGYAGMINTMKALEESHFLYYGGFKLSEVFNTSNIDPATGYPEHYENFLGWRALTSSFIPFFLWACLWICVVIMTLFIIRLFDHNHHTLAETMFPPLLEMKHMNPDLEVQKGLIGSQTFHFVRPKRFVLESTLGMGFVLLLLSFMFNNFFLNAFSYFDPDSFMFNTFVVFLSLGSLLSIFMVGFIVQIHNATTLSNILVQSMKHVSSEQRLAQFEQWKDYYKTAVGSLHIWSRRISQTIFGVIFMFGFAIIVNLVDVIFIYTHIMSEPDIIESKRMGIFLSVGSGQIILLIMFTTILLIAISLMAMISFRYKRLNLLVATLRLPTHQLDDFEILQRQNAAFTVYDVPITSNTVRSILYLLFIQTFVGALAVAGS